MIGAILLSIFFGIILTLLVQYIFFRYWFKSLPIVTDKWKSQSDPFVLPQELLNIFESLNVQDEKESYKSLNFIFQFLFQELKDADHVRKWAMKKLKNEFSELLQSTTGKLLDEIRIRGFNLGRTFPVIKNVSLSNVSINEDHAIDEVAVILDLTYNGRFQLAVDVGMVFGKSAYLSVTITKLQGTARLQFSTVPYRHWSFAFTKDPILEFEVDSHFEGRPIARLASIITNQIKRQVRKKHTLPNFKIRYKPFFVMPTQKVEPKDIFYRNMKLSIGKMNVVVVGCTRLLVTPPGSFIFCSLAIDSMPWSELMEIKKKSCSHFDCELVKSSPHLGLVFEDEFSVEKFEEVVVVTSISIGSPAHKAGIHKNDVIVTINGTKVASSKQAFRIIKQSAEKALIRVERDVSANPEVAQTAQQKHIKKVPSVDSLSTLTKDLDKKDAISKGSQESLSVPNHIEGSLGQSEGSQLRSASSAQSMTLEGKDKELKSVVASDGKSEEAFVENLLTYNPTKTEDLNIGEPGNGESVVKKTRTFKSCQNPVFNQRFKFDVKEHHNYLNICVWCQEVEKVDKQLKVTKVEKDTLLGHVSISLMDIALECSTTLQGDFTNSFNLVPSQSKIGMGRQQYAAISTHPGFEDRVCHGDILLRFHYSREDDNFEHDFDIFDSIHTENVNSMTQSRNEKASTKLHHFQPAQFQSAVHCKFCSKKIWFKSAFMCSGCNMVCHKKCIDKCQQQTTCVRVPRMSEVGGGNQVDENECEIGERKRHKSAPDDQKAAEVINQPLPPQQNNLTRKSSSSSLKDLSAAEASAVNSESSTSSKTKTNQYWKANEENADEKIVTAAKSIGKQLYNDLDIELRKEKFDEVILMTQIEIERENKHQTDLQVLEKKTVDKKMKLVLKDKIKNSEEKLKSLKILMLQYCAGLQHCLDEEESLRQRKALQTEAVNAVLDDDHQISEPISLEEPNVETDLPDNLEVENMENGDFEDKREELQMEDYLGGGESPSELVKHQLVDSLLKDEDDMRSESELLEVQALLESHQSSETSSQKSIEADTSPEDDYLPDSFGAILDLSKQPIIKLDDVMYESASGLSIEGCFDDGSNEINCDPACNISENKKEDVKSQSEDGEGKVRFEL